MHGDAAPILGPVPPSGEWSKIQVSYEKSEQEEGKATLALALSDEEVGRVGVDELNLDSGAIEIFIGPESAYSDDNDSYDSYDDDSRVIDMLPVGGIRGLMVLDK